MKKLFYKHGNYTGVNKRKFFRGLSLLGIAILSISPTIIFSTIQKPGAPYVWYQYYNSENA